MPYSTYFKNKALDVLRNQTFTGITSVYASAHTANPGDTGASEVTGGSPAYARKAMTWNAAAAGVLDSSNAPVFDIPASTTVTYIGFWDASTAGNWLAYDPITEQVYVTQGTLTLTDVDLDLNLLG